MVRRISLLAFAALFFLGLFFFRPVVSSPTEAVVPSAAVTDLEVPWQCDESYTVGPGHGSKTHQGSGHYAWDFTIPESTTITAPADGTVRRVRDDSTEYGCDQAYAWEANYVVLDIGDGFDVLLLHLEPGSALVEEGQTVTTGDPIGRVGNSGYVCGTHLHFQAQQTCESWWCPSVSATFTDGISPESGTAMKRSNCQ